MRCAPVRVATDSTSRERRVNSGDGRAASPGLPLLQKNPLISMRVYKTVCQFILLILRESINPAGLDTSLCEE